jgi:acyl carrier protein
MTELSPLEREIVELIVTECSTASVPAGISADDPIIGDGSPFGLDSLDAVEIVVGVHKRFGVRIGDQVTSRQVLRSLRTLAAFVDDHRPPL